MTNGDKLSSDKGKGVFGNIKGSIRSGYNAGKFLIEGNSRKELSSEEVEAVTKKLQAKRNEFYRLNPPSDQAEPSSSTTTRTGTEAIRPLTGKEKAQIYEVKHKIKAILEDNPNMDPPEGDPYAPKDYLSNALALRQEASAYIETGIIDRDFTEHLEGLNMTHDYLIRCLKPGAALKELMKLPDDSTVYSAQETKHLMDSFGAHFADAAKIIRKIPKAMQLVDEVAKAGVVFGGHAEEGPHQLRHAYYAPDTHAVYIPEAATDPVVAVGNFWFELTNGKNRSEFSKLGIQARAGMISKEEYVNRAFEIERGAMLKLGEIWSQTKRACKNPTELDGYDSMFHLRGYQAHLKGNDDILKIAMESAMSEGEGKTIRQRYEEQFDQLRNEGTAIRELMRLPDDPTVYSAQETKHLMDSFGAHFADAAQIVRKIQPAMQLVDEAAKAGIGFGGYAKEVPGQLSSASYVPDTHAAYIPEATVDPVRAAQNLWFTLTIGKNWSRVTELNILARAGTTAKEEYVNRRFKIDEEAVLKVGEIWSQTKRACKNPTELDGYDSMFHLQACQAHQQGDDDLLKIVMESGMVPGKTRRQFYEEQFDQLRNEATQP